MLEHLPRDARRVLDLGTGDGRLLALLRMDRRRMLGVGLDFSKLMLEAARERFADDERIELVEHDLAEPLPALGRFDAVVSSMAIHLGEPLEDEDPSDRLLDVGEPARVAARPRFRRRRLLPEVARDGFSSASSRPRPVSRSWAWVGGPLPDRQVHRGSARHHGAGARGLGQDGSDVVARVVDDGSLRADPELHGGELEACRPR